MGEEVAGLKNFVKKPKRNYMGKARKARDDRFPPNLRTLLIQHLEAGKALKDFVKKHGITRGAVQRFRKKNARYDRDYIEAEQTGAEDLEAECDRRAREHTEMPDGKGGTRVVPPSDLLMMFRLKGLRPDRYRDSPGPSLMQLGSDLATILAASRSPKKIKNVTPKKELPTDTEAIDV